MAALPVRKMARHDIEAVRTFLRAAERDHDQFHVDEATPEIQDSDFRKFFPAVDDGRRRQFTIQDGALFYAATVDDNQ